MLSLLWAHARSSPGAAKSELCHLSTASPPPALSRKARANRREPRLRSSIWRQRSSIAILLAKGSVTQKPVPKGVVPIRGDSAAGMGGELGATRSRDPKSRYSACLAREPRGRNQTHCNQG